jgi:hypothetical protein
MLIKFFSRIINEYKQLTIDNLFKDILHKETYECKIELARYLDGDGNINIRNINGIPLLNFIIQYYIGNSSILVNFLINRGADVNIKSDDGLTPLMVAVDNNDIDSVKLLLKANAELEHQDEFGYTALAYAVGNLNYDICKLLLENKADPTIKLQFSRYKHIDIDSDTSLELFAYKVYKHIPDKSLKYADFINKQYQKMRESYSPIIELIKKYGIHQN